MKYIFTIFALFFFKMSIAQSEVNGEVAGEILIQTITPFQREAGLEAIISNLSDDFFEYKILSTHFQVIQLKFDNRSFSKKNLIQKLQSHPNILTAQPNHYTSFRNEEIRPTDALYSQQWDMEIIDAPKAWNVTTGGATTEGDTIVIAVIDAGADFGHEDLQDNLWYNHAEIPNDGLDNDNNGYIDDFKGWSFDNGNDNHPPTDHGTATAGIVGAVGNNGIGVTGVNWHIKLMILSQALTEADIIAAYDYIYEMRLRYNQSNGANGAFVVASSIAQGFAGDPNEHSIWCRSYDKLGEIGVLNMAATANAPIDIDINGDVPTSCNSPHLLTVTNTSREDELRPTAAYGDVSIDIGAPGSGSFTLTWGDAYASFAGTSAATPHVSGAVGLMYALPNERFISFAKRDPEAATTLVKSILLRSVDQLPTLKNKTVSEGRLNVFKALQMLDDYFSGYSSELDMIRLYPNPVENLLFVKFQTPVSDFEMQIFNELGQTVENWTLNITEDSPMILEINTSKLQSGVYFLSLVNDNQRIVRKFVK